MKCEVLIDWLTFSVKEKDPRNVIQTYLGLDPDLFQDTGFSLMGYNKVMKFSDILVCSNGREDDYFQDMGVCVSMSGNGCRAFETMSKLSFDGAADKQGTQSVAFPVLFQLLVSDKTANVSRIDIACDDHEGYLEMNEIIRKTWANDIIERDDSNITRCTVCGWWTDFVDELEAVRLVARKVIQHSVERVANWVEAQVGPSLAVLFRTKGWPFLFELAKDAGSRLSDKQISFVTDYNSLQFARGVV